MPRLALRLQAPRLDRIVRGRAWIPVLGVLLVAIVGLRVEVLKLGSSVGSEIQQATTLQSSNAALREQISALTDNQRIAKLAETYGMHMPGALDVHFVQASVGHHVGAAIRNISTPSRSTFLPALAAEQRASQQTNQAVAAMNGVAAGTGTNTSTNTGAGTSPTSGTTSPTSTTSSGAGSSSGTTSGVSGNQTTGVPSSTGVSDTGTAGTTPPASTGAGAPGESGTTGVAAGDSTGSGTSQTTLPTGSTNGGSGLAG